MAHILFLLTKYKYLILFPISIVEGPIITMTAGFLVSTKFFNPFIAYILVLLGDMVGDSGCYFIGRGGGWLYKRFFKNKNKKEEAETAKTYFEKHRTKALVLSKVMHGIGISGLFTAGSLKIPYSKFFTVCTIVSILQSAVFLLIGIVFGSAYLQFGKYLGDFTMIVAIIAVVGIIIFLMRKKYKVKLK